MPDYDFEGKIDSDGNIEGTFTERGGYSGGPLSIVTVFAIYALCIIGGITMISNVATQAPFCIVPAVLAFIVMLIPIVIATKSGYFVLKFLGAFYKCYNILIGLIVVMFWISYILEAFSTVTLMAMGLGLMYLTIVTIVRTFQKTGKVGGIITIIVPIIIYLVVLGTSGDFLVSYFAIIPTASILLALFIEEIMNIYDFELKSFKDKKALPIIKIIISLCIVASIFLINSLAVQNKALLLQTGKDYIAEGKYVEARAILQDIKSDEAKDLYDSIRYKGIQVGEIIYNGYHDYYSDARSISENAVAFVCLDVVGDKALLISVDIIRLSEQYNGLLDETVYTENYLFDTDNIETTTISGSQTKFFLLSKAQYDVYVQNDKLDNYLKKCNVSSVANAQKQAVDNDTYKWTFAYTDFWLLNDFSTQGFNNYIGTINSQTGEFEYIYNSKVYAGIRPCYFANVE